VAALPGLVERVAQGLEQQAVADLRSLAKGRRSVGLAMPKLEDAELAGTLTRTLTLALILALALTLPLTLP